MKVNILGTDYEIIVKKYDEDEAFKKRSILGYCEEFIKQIIICDARTIEGWEDEPEMTIETCNNETLRHEIIHAFFNESGLKDSSAKFNGPWAKNEEMIDWLAIQAPKILKVFEETGCLEWTEKNDGSKNE